MRDWNKDVEIAEKLGLTSFVSYLWGIETLSVAHRTPNNSLVCILPMRDWNLFRKIRHPSKWLSLYLTYEGLKHDLTPPASRNTSSLYLTYEGLKQISKRLLFPSFTPCLYLTYEGLKHHPAFGELPAPSSFVSYLWGIETKEARRFVGLGLDVCILPMRDWN